MTGTMIAIGITLATMGLGYLAFDTLYWSSRLVKIGYVILCFITLFCINHVYDIPIENYSWGDNLRPDNPTFWYIALWAAAPGNIIIIIYDFLYLFDKKCAFIY